LRSDDGEGEEEGVEGTGIIFVRPNLKDALARASVGGGLGLGLGCPRLVVFRRDGVDFEGETVFAGATIFAVPSII